MNAELSANKLAHTMLHASCNLGEIREILDYLASQKVKTPQEVAEFSKRALDYLLPTIEKLDELEEKLRSERELAEQPN